MQHSVSKNEYGLGATESGSTDWLAKMLVDRRSNDSRVRSPWFTFRLRKSGSSTMSVTESSAHREWPRSLYREFRSDRMFQFLFLESLSMVNQPDSPSKRAGGGLLLALLSRQCRDQRTIP